MRRTAQSFVADHHSQQASRHSVESWIRFDAAASCFEDQSIDLLHIDGYHTYDAVRNDFETYISKMSRDGVIIFHDTCVHERGFGVWRFWEELRQKYPSFNFKHGHGLGIIYVGTNKSHVSDLFALVGGDVKIEMAAQTFFERLGGLVEYEAGYGAKASAATTSDDPSMGFTAPAMSGGSQAELQRIYNSRAWKLVLLLRRIHQSIFRITGLRI
jgi:hypothetical protein